MKPLASDLRLVCAFIIVIGLLLARPALAVIDQNNDGMDTIWELLYGAGLKPNATDGSGLTNLQKSIAGLIPNDPASFFRASVTGLGSGPVISWPTVVGKQYQVQTAASLTSGSWIAVGSPIPGTGAVVSSTIPVGLSRGFFDVAVSDGYTGGNLLTNWEALQLGFNPANPYSNGRLDGNGQPISDYQYVLTALSSTNVVTIAATKPSATIPDSGAATDTGLITITRTGNLNSITVPVGFLGPAHSGTDYVALPPSVTLPVGVNTATLLIVPMAGSHLLGGTPVTVALTGSSPYQIGVSGSATVVIYPSATPTGSGLTGYYYSSSSSTYTGTANFNPSTLAVTRTDSQISFYWGPGQPYTQVNRNNFSASWDGQLLAPSTGGYVFALQADAGARMYVNNQLVIDAWTANSSTAAPMLSGTVQMIAGTYYPVHVEYWENTDPASIYLTWQTPLSTSLAGIPNANVFLPGTTSTNGWTANYYNNTTLSGSAAHSVTEKAINWDWGIGSPDPSMPTAHYSVRWLGQVEPQYTEAYTFVTHTCEGAKLWINGQLITDNWTDQNTADVPSVPINLQAGVRYNLQMDYYQDKLSNGQAYLSWYSQDQPQQVIPQSRLYPASVTAAPTAITSATNAVALVGGSFNYGIAASNGGANFTVSGLPPGLTFNPATGQISGVCTQPGVYVVTITALNGNGSGSSTLTIDTIATGGAITRQLWTGVSGTNVSDIPLSTTPSHTGTLTSLASTSGTSNYGEEWTGYLTPPVTGNYYFWLTGNSSAELWISDDNDPVDNLKRAAALSPVGAPGQQSPWLSLVAGQQYYIQVLHKFGNGTGDNVAVSWLRPDQTGTSPAEIVPGYALSPYTPPAGSVQPGSLYSATLLAAPGVTSDGVGAATLLVNPSGTSATLNFSYSDLSSTVTDSQLQSDPYQNLPSQTIFDITKSAKQNPDGSYTIKIANVGSLTASDVLDIIQQGKAYLLVSTANNPSGEIRGNFTLTNGAQTFTPPTAPPSYTDDSKTDAGASRFLIQATFGPTPSEIARVESMGYSAWIDDQFTRPASHQMPYVLANPNPSLAPTYPDNLTFNSWWQQSVTAPDQLRQRVAFALSEIMVISDVGALNNNGLELTSYYDTLLDNAFGNYRSLLEAVTLTPAMGNYLNMRGNAKANYAAGLHPDENYAREVNQLFSIGLYRLWPDGSLVENAAGSLVPTYQQPTVQGFAAVFTGWNYHQALQGNGSLPTNWYPAADYTDPMTLVPTFHDLGNKLTLDNIVLPAASGSAVNPSSPAFGSYCSGDLEAAMDVIFNHSNVGPFICRELIQRLVTSNPSPAYVYRVAQVFDDNGSGVRGDLQAVIKAILLDYEARSPDAAAQPGFGKQKEPLLRVIAPARYFASTYSLSGSYTQSSLPQIVITSTSANRLTNGDVVVLNFTAGSPLPYSGAYSVKNVTPSSFSVSPAGLVIGSYTQSGNTITVSLTHGLAPGNPVYLAFPSGGATSGTYTVATVPDSEHLTVISPASATLSGTAVIAKFGGDYVVSTSSGSGQINTLDTSVNHGLNVGDTVFVSFASGSGVTGTYTVLSVPDLTHFVISGAGLSNQTHNKLSIYPLVSPLFNRSGQVSAQTSTWNIGASDVDLTQTPLNSPTVFNYYYPGYRFPGVLASAGLTTPEFQLTNATNVMLQTNFLEAGILSASSTNGFMSFRNGNGSIEMDVSPYLNLADNNDIPSLVDLLNNQLMGGSMTTAMRSAIITYVTNTANFPYSTPPTTAQQANRVRAIVHLIVTSPEFTIQQ